MYTIIESRKINPERNEETVQLAQSEYFPKLQKAAGFTGFYLTPDESNGTYTAVVVWQSKDHADAFAKTASDWGRILDEHGHTVQSDNRGETRVRLEPQR